MKILNQTANNIDLYVYGEIVDEKWWESDVDSSDFRDAFDAMEAGDTLNIYMNSGGGSVFTAVAICAIIDRLKAKGVAVVFVGEDLDVLLALCDRILVLCDGQVSGIVDARTTTKEEIGLLMTSVGGKDAKNE